LEKLGLNLGFLLLQIVNFAIILIVLRAWVYKPLIKMLEKRRMSIAQGLEDARIASEARANAEDEAKRLLEEANAKAAEIVREADTRAEAVKKEILAEAETEATHLRKQKMAEFEQERVQILAGLREEVVALSMAATQKLVQESLTQERQRGLLKEFFSGVKAGRVVVLEDAEVTGAAAEVTSALPLTADEQSMVKSELLGKLKEGASISFRVDPKILGGLVVRVGDRVVDGSVAGQMLALRQSL
jgi:F-type H+-transporting ATPase subunit b